ncbi:DUF2249 domain-containing protein [Kribbella sp. NPDC050459]|uniref:DUF2249 domain-containing protein n=1 Tax=Kribbella sp. NPDC050459 TaxID=3155785 RepID=UPI0033E65686
MNDVTIASSEAEVHAGEAVERHHSELAGALVRQVEALSAAAAARRWQAADTARLGLVEWCRTELVPHALAEERTLYAEAAQREDLRLLVEAMVAEHQVIVGLVDILATTTDALRAAELARALSVLFGAHLAKENEQVLPILLAAPDVSVAQLLAGMHELIGGEAHSHPGPNAPADESNHACACGDGDGPVLELDSSAIPHAVRHGAIFGALDALRPGSCLVLTASHDPLPLLAQLEQRAPGRFSVEYVAQGPDVWRLAFKPTDQPR